MQSPKDKILQFWFEDIAPQQWFQASPEFDAQVKEEFEATYDAALSGAFVEWEHDADGVLALCILLDQFPRMMFRGSAKAFDADPKILVIVKKALHMGLDQVLSPIKRRFMYLPFMHSEHLNDQKKSVELFEAMKDEDPVGYKHALQHFELIEKFDRFPYRNAALGRTNTPDEDGYLNPPS